MPADRDGLFDDEAEALAVCEAALRWLTRYRDAHGGLFPVDIFNALIRLRPSTSPEVIVHRMEDGLDWFWLTLRDVDDADPFNGMWHYTGTVERSGDYVVGGVRRVLEHELGVEVGDVTALRRVASIYPVRSRRCDIMSTLFLCTLRREPRSGETGRWFSATEIARLVPMRAGGEGIVPSHLVGLLLCLRHLGRESASPFAAPSPLGFVVGDGEGFSQQVMHVDALGPSALA